MFHKVLVHSSETGLKFCHLAKDILVVHMNLRLAEAILALTVGFYQSQPPTTERPKFDVVSVKPLRADLQNSRPRLNCAGGNLVSSGVPLKYIIEWAFDIRTEFTVPDWANEGGERFSIEAKAEGPASQAQCKLMTQVLLEDRFQLKSHREKREAPIFELVLAKGGAKLTPVIADAPPGDGVWMRGNKVSSKGWEAWMIAATLQPIRGVDRPVVDKTGLKGLFEFRLDYAVRPDEDRPDIFKAVQDQLGLKLVSSKGPVEFFTVDHLGKPSEN